MLKKSLIPLLLLALAQRQLQALGPSAAMKAYLAMKQDSSLYLGEGIAVLKDFGGDALKAADAAKARAQSDLASSISVQIRSESSEKLESTDGKVTEQLKSESHANTNLALDNLSYLELKDFPEEGQIMVLASLSKQDYRRQLAGKKIVVYLPEWGLGVSWGGEQLKSFSGHENAGSALGLEAIFRNFVLSAGTESDVVYFPQVANSGTGISGTTLGPSNSIQRIDFAAGYNWTPWATLIQPFLPLRLEYEMIGGEGYSVGLSGASAGLGLRYWPTDSFALELKGGYTFGLNTVTIPLTGEAFNETMDVNLNRIEFSIGLMWSGY
jgi:hypothetical protein